MKTWFPARNTFLSLPWSYVPIKKQHSPWWPDQNAWWLHEQRTCSLSLLCLLPPWLPQGTGASCDWHKEWQWGQNFSSGLALTGKPEQAPSDDKSDLPQTERKGIREKKNSSHVAITELASMCKSKMIGNRNRSYVVLMGNKSKLHPANANTYTRLGK